MKLPQVGYRAAFLLVLYAYVLHPLLHPLQTLGGMLQAVARYAPFRLKVLREDLIHYGQLYMRRWAIRLPGGEIRLHYTASPDGAREHLHDHPWAFVSVLLWGGYTHRVQRAPPAGPVQEVRRWLPGSVSIMPYGLAHVITEVSPRGAWTLVFTGRKREREQPIPEDGLGGQSTSKSPSYIGQGPRQLAWGFWVDGRWTAARAYFHQHPDSAQFDADIHTYLEAGNG